MCLRSSVPAKGGFEGNRMRLRLHWKAYLANFKQVLTLKTMHKALHAPNFLRKWFSVLIRRSVYPVIEERLLCTLVRRQRQQEVTKTYWAAERH